MKVNRNNVLLSIPVIIVLVAIILIFSRDTKKANNFLVGVIETTVVDVASEIPGRVQEVNVVKGDVVEKGQVLATLKPNVMDAKVGQAKGVMEAAKSMYELAQKGARVEEKKAAKNKYEIAKSQFEFAEKTYTRIQNLYADSVVSKQEFDEIQFKYNAAKEQMKAAQALYNIALKGARPEQIEAAMGKFAQAENVYNEAVAFQEQLKIIAPCSGEISNRIAEPGEVVPAGYPVLSVQIPEDCYAILQVREDKLAAFKKGKEFVARIPALEDNEFKFKVSFIAPMANFATWTPTNQKGGFDLRTFEVHLKPVNPIKDLRPGMTLRVNL
ncbi:MAG: HlyD family secretion protein [Hyphomicrobiales bacterium]